jgi:hypothetical protein
MLPGQCAADRISNGWTPGADEDLGAPAAVHIDYPQLGFAASGRTWRQRFQPTQPTSMRQARDPTGG